MEVPGDIAVTRPLTEPMVATEVVPLDQVPPVVALLSVVVVPRQIPKVPVIGDVEFTVIVFVATQVPIA